MLAAISVVIPTKNAGHNFINILYSIRNQKVYQGCEIVIIDSGSTDNTLEIANNFDAKIVSIDPHSFNHGETRNLGASHSCGDYIFFLTQDAIPASDAYLLKMLTTIHETDTDAAYARQIPRSDASSIVIRDLDSWYSGSSKSRNTRITSPNDFHSLSSFERYRLSLFDDVASVIRRDVWEKMPFPRTQFGEDIEWGYRALCNGYALLYNAEAAVIHSHERSTRYLYNRTAIEHYCLYNLFRMRTIPTRHHAMRSFAITAIKDMVYLIRAPQKKQSWLRNLAYAPQCAWASAWGQYIGAKTAANGATLHLTHEV